MPKTSETLAKKIVYPPGPKDALFGITLYRASQREPLRFMERLSRTFGDVVHFKIGKQEVYLLNHPDLIKGVLLSHYTNFVKGRGVVRRNNFFGEGLLTSEGDFHRRQRQQTQPAFHHERLGVYGAVMSKLAVDASDSWEVGKPLDVLGAMRQITLPITSHTLFGANVSTSHDEIIDAFRTGLTQFRLFKPTATRVVDSFSMAQRWRVKRARSRLEHLISRIIAERRAQPTERGDLLSLLLSRNSGEGDTHGSDQQIRDEAVTLFIGGFESIATALTWTWYLLTHHPECELKLHQELDTVLNGRLPEVSDVPRLPYTRMVLEEAMRLYPPVPRLVRTAVGEYQAGTYTIPGRSLVVVSQYLMHRDARYFPDPEKFDPERWTVPAKSSRPPYSFFPFGGGPRRCIGEGFAYMEGVLVLATLASRWKLMLNTSTPLELNVTHFLHPRNLTMTIARRSADVNVGVLQSVNKSMCAVGR